jgi:hypothetical protein
LGSSVPQLVPQFGQFMAVFAVKMSCFSWKKRWSFAIIVTDKLQEVMTE